MFFELKATSKIQAIARSQKFYFTGKECPYRHNEGRLARKGKCVVCFTKKHKRLKLAAQRRKIANRLSAQYEPVWNATHATAMTNVDNIADQLTNDILDICARKSTLAPAGSFSQRRFP